MSRAGLPRPVRALGRTLAACAAAVWLLATATAGYAAPSDFHERMQDLRETGQPGLLSLTSSVFPLHIPWLEPGHSFSWQVGLHLADEPVADGTLEFIPHGGLTKPNTGYRLTAKRCETQWTGQSGTDSAMSCASGAKILLADAPLESGPTAHIPFGDVAASTSPHILFTLALPKGSTASDPFTFALGFTVMGDETTTDYGLPDTGFSGLGMFSAAVALLGVGLFAVLTGRRAGRS